MNNKIKKIENLTVDDLKTYPVWQYVNDDNIGETVIKPIKKIPVNNLIGRLVGTLVTFNNGDKYWTIISNIDINNSKLNEHFLTLSIEKNGKWFTLARYHDFDYQQKGPEALSIFLGIEIDEIFPITYDITAYSKGEIKALSGQILKEPKVRLSRAEIIALAVP